VRCSKSCAFWEIYSTETYVRKEERPTISHLSFLLRKLEKEKKIKSKVSMRKEIL
jgi:hypothetical protein